MRLTSGWFVKLTCTKNFFSFLQMDTCKFFFLSRRNFYTPFKLLLLFDIDLLWTRFFFQMKTYLSLIGELQKSSLSLWMSLTCSVHPSVWEMNVMIMLGKLSAVTPHNSSFVKLIVSLFSKTKHLTKLNYMFDRHLLLLQIKKILHLSGHFQFF